MPPRGTPSGLAIVVCDHIIEDKLTNKKSLIGIFNNIHATSFPCRHPQLSVFVSLTEGFGQYNARLRIVNEETSEVVTDVRGPIQFPDVNAVVELVFNLVGLVFPSPGLYSIEFYCDEVPVLERRFHVSHSQPAKGPPPEEM
ncbi:MAG: hypothetical protein N3B01_05740 [Verrucomicrobiae bacterium]|nr:hypothetical protein [Verrucomicrobiae bacterium]